MTSQTTDNLNYFGQRVRELREKKELLLRQVAAHLEVDTALMSKIERGDRNASKDQNIAMKSLRLTTKIKSKIYLRGNGVKCK